MTKLKLIFLFLVGTTVVAWAQSHDADSLLAIVRENKNDARHFRALTQLGAQARESDSRRAVLFYREAVSLPFRSEYAREFVDACYALGDLYRTLGVYDSSYIRFQQSADLAQKFRFDRELGLSHQGAALTFLNQSKNDSARARLNLALTYFLQLKDRALEAGVYLNLGNIFLSESNYNDALAQYINAAKIYENSVHDPLGLSKAWANIGNIEASIGQYEKALAYADKSLRLSQEIKNELSVAYCHRLKGRIFRKLGKPEGALAEYQEALQIYRKRSDYLNEGETLQIIGNTYFDERQFMTAIEHYARSLDICRRINNPSLLAYNYSSLGQTWFELKNFDRAIAYLDSATAKAREIKNRYLVMDSYQMIAQIRETQKNFPAALALQHAYMDLKDSLTAEENLKGTQEMEVKYENAKKQSQIELLQKERQLKNISLQQSLTIQTAMAIAFGLLLIIGALIFNRNRLINRARQQMEIEHMRNEIARDLHDDMGSTLSSINIISQLAIKEEQTEQGKKYFHRIADQSAKMMESMSDMVWSINPENDSLPKVLAKMKEFAAEILEPKNISVQFKGEESLNAIVLNVAQRKNLFLIFKEAINNAAKYSESEHVTISLAKAGSGLQLEIRDNGRGFEKSKTSPGNGLRNMSERAAEIGAMLSIQSAPGAGTTLVLMLPLT